MRKVSYIFLLALLLAACGGWRDGDRLLSEADGLLYSHPDSAQRLLDSIPDGDLARMSQAQRMRYELLRADAQNKRYVKFTSDSVLKEVVEYYDRKGTANERMRANYLLGRAYYDMGETPMALKYYHEAADQADTTQADCDYKLLSRVHGQMGRIFLDQGAPRNALDELDAAQRCALSCEDTLMYLSSYSFKGSAYEYLNMLDSALAVKREACRLYELYGYKKESAMCMVPVFDILLKNGLLDEAKEIMERYEVVNRLSDKNIKISKGKEIYYYFRGKYYSELNNQDSAMFFFRKLLVNATTTNHYECGYAGMSKAFHQLGLQDSAYYYASLAYSYNDSCHREKSTLDYQRNQSVFNYTRYQQLAERKTKEATVNRFMWIITSAALLLLLTTSFLILLLFRNRAARQKIKQQEMSLRISELERLNQEITASRDELDLMLRIKMKNAIPRGEVTTPGDERSTEALGDDMFENLIELKKQSIEEKNRFYQQLLESVRHTDPARSSEEVLKDMPVIASLKKKTTAKGSSLMSETQWEELKESIDKANPLFPRFLFESCPRLRPEERKVLYLTKAFFSTGEISLLTGLSKTSISMMKSRLIKKIFGTEGGAKDLEKRLSQL